MKKRIPIGVDDFKEIRDEGYYFVDKSELISDILSERNKVYLFTRPRRFGKSLNLSMLDAFFNLKYPKDNKWFDGLKVSDCKECQEHKNEYPIIYFDFKDLDAKDCNRFLGKLRQKLSDLYSGYGYLPDSDELDRKDVSNYNDILDCTADDSVVEYSLKNLSKMLYKHHGTKVVVLIDEYDNPINNSFGKSHQNEIIQIIRGMLSSLLKGNTYLEFAVITGVMQIAKESIFSGLNNLSVNNIFSKKFDERYGFTEDEVKTLCKEYDHPEKFKEAKEWYDGYRFGDAEIYNPWSVLRYISENFIPATYWSGTSGNDIINTLLDSADDGVYSELHRLGNGESIISSLNSTVIMNDIGVDGTAIYSIMAVSGYLNAVPDDSDAFLLSIPNKEMYKVFAEMMTKHINDSASVAFAYLFDGMEDMKIDKMQKALDMIFNKNIPFILLSKEKDYQLILGAAAMSRLGRYTVSLEEESGNGRADIIMRPNRSGLPNIILEMKRSDSVNDLESDSSKAISQIEEKGYFRNMKGRTLLYGISFNGKSSRISMKEMTS